ncbi:hypothetical protein [Cupriavidus pauculus]|uniref:hypothetical protein n=1 Tax=Cupriavidus pauculus TaxID=82633 RepID=UPI0015DDDED8|nr:hypothetical protein [Cupriavidus pauculus]
MKGAVYTPPSPDLPHLVVIMTDDGMIANVSAASSSSEGQRLLAELQQQMQNTIRGRI